MLDAIQCPTSVVDQWVMFTGTFGRWLSHPENVALVLLIAFGLAHLFLRRRGRQVVRMGLLVLAFMYGALLFPPTLNLSERALVALLPEDSGQSADAIVVLGRGTELSPERVKVAKGLWNAHRAPLIFVSGAGDAPVMLHMLETNGVPEHDLAGEGCSRTTKENAQFTAERLQPRGVRKILLVTDPPHMLRSLLTFQGQGFSVIPVPSPLPAGIGQHGKATVVLREYAGLVTYGLRGRLFPSHSKISASPAPGHSSQPYRG